jgi:hypothetical protein
MLKRLNIMLVRLDMYATDIPRTMSERISEWHHDGNCVVAMSMRSVAE